jgi:hypothetical protein
MLRLSCRAAERSCRPGIPWRQETARSSPLGRGDRRARSARSRLTSGAPAATRLGECQYSVCGTDAAGRLNAVGSRAPGSGEGAKRPRVRCRGGRPGPFSTKYRRSTSLLRAEGSSHEGSAPVAPHARGTLFGFPATPPRIDRAFVATLSPAHLRSDAGRRNRPPPPAQRFRRNEQVRSDPHRARVASARSKRSSRALERRSERVENVAQQRSPSAANARQRGTGALTCALSARTGALAWCGTRPFNSPLWGSPRLSGFTGPALGGVESPSLTDPRGAHTVNRRSRLLY